MPSEGRGDTGVTTVVADGESPSGTRGDVGVTTVDRGDTGDATVVTPVSPLYQEEPSVLTTSTPLPPAVDLGDDVAAEGVGLGLVGDSVDDDLPVGGRGVEVVRADWGLCRRVLPESMQALDDPGVELVAGLLRERIEAGWPMSDLRAALAANPMPDQVRHLAGLVAHRVRQIPPEGAPPQRRPAGVREAQSEVGRRGVVPVWMRRRAEARAAGDPSGRQPVTWWMERFPAGGSGTAES